MFGKKLLIIFMLFSCCYPACAAVFVVTSNADAGPGTFRDALSQAAANGSATTDFINFNIADLSLQGRTITVLSDLPGISSNLVIDASTQPGLVFDRSQAKVCLLFNSTGQNIFTALSIENQTDVSIYGMYLRLTNTFDPKLTNPVGIKLVATNNFQLGDAQKGNVISGFFYPFAINDDGVSTSSGVIIKSNMLSIQADGVTMNTGEFSPTISNIYGNVTIGGTAAEGNLLAMGIRIKPHTSKFCTINLTNNLSGSNYNQTNTFSAAGIDIAETIGETSNSAVNIADNTMAANGNYDVPLFVGSLGGVVNIIRNHINVDKSLNALGIAEYGVYVQICNEVHIGDNDPADANYIGYCRPIFAENAGSLTFTKNSFFCTTNNAVYFDENGQNRTQCNLAKLTPNSASGTATPNAIVDLYYTDKCKSCSAQTYIASVNADGAGNWSYNNSLTGTVVANATFNKISSEFTFPHINTDNLQVNNACGGPGSITGIKVYNAGNIKWIDGNGMVVGTTPDLLDLKPGKYKLLVDNGGCSASAGYYTILAKFTLNKGKVVATKPSCGNSAGSIKGLTITNTDRGYIVATWKDAGGTVITNKLDLENVPAGTYYFSAVGVDTCIQTYGPIVLNEEDRTLAAPSANSLTLCSAGTTFLVINNPTADHTYNLYDSANATTPFAKSNDGRFQLDILKDEVYYVSQAFFSCESPRTAVKILVGLDPSAIPNAITPNGDGVNDFWAIPGIEKFPNAQVRIFSRNGQKIFDSKGYARAFDGTINGSNLPQGVYYYVISLASDCNFSGSLTIIR